MIVLQHKITFTLVKCKPLLKSPGRPRADFEETLHSFYCCHAVGVYISSPNSEPVESIAFLSLSKRTMCVRLGLTPLKKDITSCRGLSFRAASYSESMCR